MTFRSLLFALLAATLSLPGLANSQSSTASLAHAPEEVEAASASQAKQVGRTIAYLTDALSLNTQQSAALHRSTFARLHELSQAASPAAVAQARQRYLLAAGRVLSRSQFEQFLALQEQLAGTMLDETSGI